MKKFILCIMIVLLSSSQVFAQISAELDVGALHKWVAVGGGVKIKNDSGAGFRLRALMTFPKEYSSYSGWIFSSGRAKIIAILASGEYTFLENENFPLGVYVGVGGGFLRGLGEGGGNAFSVNGYGGVIYRINNGPNGIFAEAGVDYIRSIGDSDNIGDTAFNAMFGYRYYFDYGKKTYENIYEKPYDEHILPQ